MTGPAGGVMAGAMKGAGCCGGVPGPICCWTGDVFASSGRSAGLCSGALDESGSVGWTAGEDELSGMGRGGAVGSGASSGRVGPWVARADGDGLGDDGPAVWAGPPAATGADKPAISALAGMGWVWSTETDGVSNDLGCAGGMADGVALVVKSVAMLAAVSAAGAGVVAFGEISCEEMLAPPGLGPCGGTMTWLSWRRMTGGAAAAVSPATSTAGGWLMVSDPVLGVRGVAGRTCDPIAAPRAGTGVAATGGTPGTASCGGSSGMAEILTGTGRCTGAPLRAGAGPGPEGSARGMTVWLSLVPDVRACEAGAWIRCGSLARPTVPEGGLGSGDGLEGAVAWDCWLGHVPRPPRIGPRRVRGRRRGAGSKSAIRVRRLHRAPIGHNCVFACPTGRADKRDRRIGQSRIDRDRCGDHRGGEFHNRLVTVRVFRGARGLRGWHRRPDGHRRANDRAGDHLLGEPHRDRVGKERQRHVWIAFADRRRESRCGCVRLNGPQKLVDGAIKKRKAAIGHRIPDMLDMVSTTVEAGVALNSALATATASMKGPLAEEIEMVLSDVRLGRNRADAFNAMAQRTHQVDLAAFVMAIVQTERLGGNIGHVLDELAEEARSRRLQRAEEIAAALPVKMVLPMAFLMLPALFVMIFTPIVAQLVGGK